MTRNQFLSAVEIYNRHAGIVCSCCQGSDLDERGTLKSFDGWIRRQYHCQNDLCELYESAQVLIETPMTPEQWEAAIPAWVKAQRPYPHEVSYDPAGRRSIIGRREDSYDDQGNLIRKGI